MVLKGDLLARNAFAGPSGHRWSYGCGRCGGCIHRRGSGTRTGSHHPSGHRCRIVRSPPVGAGDDHIAHDPVLFVALRNDDHRCALAGSLQKDSGLVLLPVKQTAVAHVVQDTAAVVVHEFPATAGDAAGIIGEGEVEAAALGHAEGRRWLPLLAGDRRWPARRAPASRSANRSGCRPHPSRWSASASQGTNVPAHDNWR